MLVGSLVVALGGVFIIIAFLIFVSGIVFSIAMTPTIIDTFMKIDNGRGAGLKLWPEYTAGFKFFWVILGLGILQSLISIGSFVLLIIPGIIVSVFVGFYIFARIIDGKNGFSAFTESYSLVQGRWWKVFGRLFVAGLAYFVAAMVLLLIDFIIGLIFGSKSAITTILIAILPFAFTSVAVPLMLAYLFKMYGSLKATRLAPVATGTFKKWLIAFLVVGIIAVILVPMTGTFAIISGFQKGMIRNDNGFFASTTSQTNFNQIIQNMSASSSNY
jgi:hypothetical protein